MERRSSGYMFAFIVNLAAFFVNLALFIVWMHYDKFGPAVVNGCAGAFSFVLAMVNLSRFLNASFQEDVEATYRRIYGK